MIAREDTLGRTETAPTATATGSATGTARWSFASPTATATVAGPALMPLTAAEAQHPEPRTSSTAGSIIVQRYEYTGRELASEASGYYFFRYRSYGPALGQFFSRDPLGYVDGMGLYAGVFAWHLGQDTEGTQTGQPTPGTNSTACSFCGPDVTAEVRRTLNVVQWTFARWQATGARDTNGVLKTRIVCAGIQGVDLSPGAPASVLPSWSIAAGAWDIVELHRHAVFNTLVPAGSPCSSGPCSNTVWFNGSCSYAGSVNYLVFGHMARLCGIGQDGMAAMIWAWKGPIPFVRPAAPNFGPSVAYAKAGHGGWPNTAAATLPPGDRPNCGPCPFTMPLPGRFRVLWTPYVL